MCLFLLLNENMPSFPVFYAIPFHAYTKRKFAIVDAFFEFSLFKLRK